MIALTENVVDIPVPLFGIVLGIIVTGIISWAAFATKNMLALARTLDISNTQLRHLTEQVAKLTEQVRQLELSQARHHEGDR